MSKFEHCIVTISYYTNIIATNLYNYFNIFVISKAIICLIQTPLGKINS